MKALIISVGTGTKPGQETLESLAHGLLYSITNQNPDKIFFITSKESREKLLPLIIPNIDKEYEIITLENIDDINKIYSDLSVKLKTIKKEFNVVTVDFTSGTKAMTGALTILGSLLEVNNLSYVVGDRQNGIVVKGRENLLTIQPYSIICDKKLAEAISFFNKYQFTASLDIIDQILSSAPIDILEFKNSAMAYVSWDKFNHEEAFKIMQNIKNNLFAKNKAFLGKLTKAREKGPFLIADIINNARRRGEEGKYDDAVARLYRVIELIGQYRLRLYEIDNTGDVPRNKIPASLQNDFKDNNDKIQIGLDMDYKFLNAFGDELGKKYLQDNKIRDALKKRNDSILAHGLIPIDETSFNKLMDVVSDFSYSTIKDFDDLLQESKFIKWPL